MFPLYPVRHEKKESKLVSLETDSVKPPNGGHVSMFLVEEFSDKKLGKIKRYLMILSCTNPNSFRSNFISIFSYWLVVQIILGKTLIYLSSLTIYGLYLFVCLFLFDQTQNFKNLPPRGLRLARWRHGRALITSDSWSSNLTKTTLLDRFAYAFDVMKGAAVLNGIEMIQSCGVSPNRKRNVPFLGQYDEPMGGIGFESGGHFRIRKAKNWHANLIWNNGSRLSVWRGDPWGSGVGKICVKKTTREKRPISADQTSSERFDENKVKKKEETNLAGVGSSWTDIFPAGSDAYRRTCSRRAWCTVGPPAPHIRLSRAANDVCFSYQTFLVKTLTINPLLGVCWPSLEHVTYLVPFIEIFERSICVVFHYFGFSISIASFPILSLRNTRT